MSTTTVCPLGGPYYTGSTACTSTTTVCPLGGLYIMQVPLYINYYSVSLGWSLYYTGSSVRQPVQYVHVPSLHGLCTQFPLAVRQLPQLIII